MIIFSFPTLNDSINFTIIVFLDPTADSSINCAITTGRNWKENACDDTKKFICVTRYYGNNSFLFSLSIIYTRGLKNIKSVLTTGM